MNEEIKEVEEIKEDGIDEKALELETLELEGEHVGKPARVAKPADG